MIFRTLRIGFLLVVLAFVAIGAWLARARSTDWDKPLWIAIYPVNADGTDVAERHIRALTPESFASVEEFMAREATRHEAPLADPVTMRLYDRVESLPPGLDADSGMLSRALWSLRLRYWAWRATAGQDHPPPDISMFVLYHDPALSPTVPHSLGLQKGLLGVVHVFADRAMYAPNNIVIAHELLHTLGATDKYDPTDDRPVFPGGFANPDQRPLYPQQEAEVMAGRRMLSESDWEMPDSLRDVVIGPVTAAEINWIDAD